jgi:hypothetical protein
MNDDTLLKHVVPIIAEVLSQHQCNSGWGKASFLRATAETPVGCYELPPIGSRFLPALSIHAKTSEELELPLPCPEAWQLEIG